MEGISRNRCKHAQSGVAAGVLSKQISSKAIIRYIALSMLVVLAPPAHSQPRERPLPPVFSTLSDEVGVLTVPQGRKLAKTLADIEEQTGVTVVMVILATARPGDIETYVQRLIDRWRRESKRLDHGRFVFVVVAREDRAVRIVPSEKLAWVLKAIGNSEMAVKVPALLKQDKYFEALSAIAEKLSQLLADPGRVVLERIELRRSEVFPGINLALQKPVAGYLIAYAMKQAQRGGSG